MIQENQDFSLKDLPFEEMLKKEAEMNSAKFKGQSFTSYKTKYILDYDKKVLVECGVEDVNALIQSNADCALDRILDKYLNLGGDVNKFFKVVASSTTDIIDAPGLDSNDDLEVLLSAKNSLNELRVRYRVPDDVSDENFIKFLNIKYQEATSLLNKHKNLKKDEKIQIKENLDNKEVKKDEKIQIKENEK